MITTLTPGVVLDQLRGATTAEDVHRAIDATGLLSPGECEAEAAWRLAEANQYDWSVVLHYAAGLAYRLSAVEVT